MDVDIVPARVQVGLQAKKTNRGRMKTRMIQESATSFFSRSSNLFLYPLILQTVRAEFGGQHPA